MNKNVIVGVAVIVAVIVGTLYTLNRPDDAVVETKVVEESASVNTSDTNVVDVGASMMTGSYESYAPEKIARAKDGDVVLFFHASWCPSCRSLDAHIESNMTTIPKGTSILKVNYDTATDLKKKYGVTYQHTLVQVDGEGNLIHKWSGSPTLSRLVQEIR